MKLNLEQVKPFYQKGTHGLNHIKRVTHNALKISETEDCDQEVVKAAALLHDIARWVDEVKDQGLCHAQEGAKKATELLKNYDYTPEQKKNIIHCIRVHRYSTQLKPETIEAAIIQDADRLDALGAMIISRVLYQAGKVKGVIHDPIIPIKDKYEGANKTTTAINHFYEKVLKIKPETFHTKKGRELAVKRYQIVKEFVKNFEKEWV